MGAAKIIIIAATLVVGGGTAFYVAQPPKPVAGNVTTTTTTAPVAVSASSNQVMVPVVRKTNGVAAPGVGSRELPPIPAGYELTVKDTDAAPQGTVAKIEVQGLPPVERNASPPGAPGAPRPAVAAASGGFAGGMVPGQMVAMAQQSAKPATQQAEALQEALGTPLFHSDRLSLRRAVEYAWQVPPDQVTITNSAAAGTWKDFRLAGPEDTAPEEFLKVLRVEIQRAWDVRVRRDGPGEAAIAE
jgi:hypothetical protein